MALAAPDLLVGKVKQAREGEQERQHDHAHALAGLTGEDSLKAALEACLDPIYTLHNELAAGYELGDFKFDRPIALVHAFNVAYNRALNELAASHKRTAA